MASQAQRKGQALDRADCTARPFTNGTSQANRFLAQVLAHVIAIVNGDRQDYLTNRTEPNQTNATRARIAPARSPYVQNVPRAQDNAERLISQLITGEAGLAIGAWPPPNGPPHVLSRSTAISGPWGFSHPQQCVLILVYTD
jgi:hypothetical protein